MSLTLTPVIEGGGPGGEGAGVGGMKVRGVIEGRGQEECRMNERRGFRVRGCKGKLYEMKKRYRREMGGGGDTGEGGMKGRGGRSKKLRRPCIKDFRRLCRLPVLTAIEPGTMKPIKPDGISNIFPLKINILYDKLLSLITILYY